MKRNWGILFRENAERGYQPGDDAAHRVAAALAERADAPTIEALSDILTLFERFGGQFHVSALRIQPTEGAEWETAGLDFQFESRDARLRLAVAPTDVRGIPISDMETPPPEIELPAPEPTEDRGDEGDLRDEIEAEVASKE